MATPGTVVADAGLSIVKSAAPRTVLRGDGRVVKVYRDTTLGDRLRRRLLGRSPARREAENLRRAHAAGLPVPRILEDVAPTGAPGEERLVLREIPGARPLDAIVLAGGLEPPRRHALTRALGELIRRILDAGLDHADLHAGNVLVAGDDRLVLVDLHRAGFRPRLTDRARRRALVSLGRFFLLHATRADRLRFLVAADPEAGRRNARDLETSLRRSCEAFWRRRLDRRYVRSRHVRPAASGGFRGTALTTFEGADEIGRDDPDARCLKEGRTAAVHRRHLHDRDVVVKHYRLKKRLAPLRNLFRGSRARRAFRAGHALLMRGLPTAEPLAWLERSVFPGLRGESLLATAFVPGIGGLDAIREVPVAERRRRAVALGRTIRRLREAGFTHRDLKLDNWIWPEKDGEPVLLDLDGLRHGHIGPVRTGRHLERLDRDLAAAGASRTDRLRTIDAALGPIGREARRRVLDGLARRAQDRREPA